MPDLVLTRVTSTSASERDRRRGLIAYLELEVNGLRLDGVTLRRSTAGHVYLSYPARRDAQGREHRYFDLLDADARRELESQVFAQLDLESGGAA